MPTQRTKRYLIFCEPCSFKKILETDKPEDLYIIKRSAIPGGVPQIDPTTKKVKVPKATAQPTMCKCPNCGRGATLKNLPDVYAKTLDEIDKKNREEQEKIERTKRITDGTPPDRVIDPDFTG